MKKCPECDIEFEPIKTKTIFCSGKCRTKAFRKKHKKEDVKRGRPSKISKEYKRQLEIMDQIAAIQKEKIPPERNTTLGKIIWDKEQKQRIKDLTSQITF